MRRDHQLRCWRTQSGLEKEVVAVLPEILVLHRNANLWTIQRGRHRSGALPAPRRVTGRTPPEIWQLPYWQRPTCIRKPGSDGGGEGKTMMMVMTLVRMSSVPGDNASEEPETKKASQNPRMWASPRTQGGVR